MADNTEFEKIQIVRGKCNVTWLYHLLSFIHMSLCYSFYNTVFHLLTSFYRRLAFKQLVLLMKDVCCKTACLQPAAENSFTCVIFTVSRLEVPSLLTLTNCSDKALCKASCLSRCRRVLWSRTLHCKAKQCNSGIYLEILSLFPSAKVKGSEAINRHPQLQSPHSAGIAGC